jgi:nitrite reductase (NADH) small subunit
MKYLFCELSELKEREPYVKNINGVEIGMIQIKDELMAFENQCPHAGGPVCLGNVFGAVMVELEDDKSVVREYVSDEDLRVVCPWHGFEFNIESGICTTDQKYKLRKFETSVKEGKAFVSIPHAASNNDKKSKVKLYE